MDGVTQIQEKEIRLLRFLWYCKFPKNMENLDYVYSLKR